MMRVCGNPIFMLPITVYGRLLGRGGGVSCKDGNGIIHVNFSSPLEHEAQQARLKGLCQLF